MKEEMFDNKEYLYKNMDSLIKLIIKCIDITTKKELFTNFI